MQCFLLAFHLAPLVPDHLLDLILEMMSMLAFRGKVFLVQDQMDLQCLFLGPGLLPILKEGKLLGVTA